MVAPAEIDLVADVPVLPSVADGSGYVLSKSDLEFLSLTPDSVWWLHRREAPLGLTPSQFQDLISDLEWALRKHGVREYDVRLQGSAARGFSSPHKPMPFTRTQIARTMAEIDSRAPTLAALNAAVEKIGKQWPTRPRPTQRPFDSLHRLGIEDFPSDLDIQISSQEMIQQVRDDLRRLGVDPRQMRIKNRRYSFVEKRFAEKFFAQIRDWSLDYTTCLARSVNWALFPASGPAEYRRNPTLSSHFKPTDWVLLEASVSSAANSSSREGQDA